MKKINTHHGMRETKIYYTWRNMKKRCSLPSNKNYKNYGARGIKVCDKWHSFESFWEWARNNGYVEGLSIERIDNDGDYCPENCIWIPIEDQAFNRRNSIYYKGELATHAGLRLGGSITLIHSRLENGWSMEKAFTTPVRKIKN